MSVNRLSQSSPCDGFLMCTSYSIVVDTTTDWSAFW